MTRAGLGKRVARSFKQFISVSFRPLTRKIAHIMVYIQRVHPYSINPNCVRYRAGPGGIGLESLILTALVNMVGNLWIAEVSVESWQYIRSYLTSQTYSYGYHRFTPNIIYHQSAFISYSSPRHRYTMRSYFTIEHHVDSSRANLTNRPMPPMDWKLCTWRSRQFLPTSQIPIHIGPETAPWEDGKECGWWRVVLSYQIHPKLESTMSTPIA